MAALRDAVKFPLYLMTHPADGFYGMKFEKRGRVSVLVINLTLCWLSYGFMSQYGGIVINTRHPQSFNGLVALLVILSLYLLFCVGNWSVTSLMEGEGRFVDIAMAVSYALTPINLTLIPATLLSNFLTESETAFFFMLVGMGIVWFVILLFMGVLTVHNFTAGRTFAALFLTLIAMIVIVFIIMMFAALWQQVYIFVRSVYIELSYQ